MNRNTPEYRRMMKEAIERLEVEDPQKLVVLKRRAKDAQFNRQYEAERDRELREAAEREKFARLSVPVVVALPDIDMSGVRGIVAYRTWSFDGRLKSTAMSYYWKGLNFADSVPSKRNNNGFYCIKLSSLGVMTSGSNYFSIYGKSEVSGFVELLGEVVEHSDGILRAEVAKLICLFVTSDNSNPMWTVRRLYENYVVPVHVLNPEQLADVILREVLRQKYLRGR